MELDTVDVFVVVSCIKAWGELITDIAVVASEIAVTIVSPVSVDVSAFVFADGVVPASSLHLTSSSSLHLSRHQPQLSLTVSAWSSTIVGHQNLSGSSSDLQKSLLKDKTRLAVHMDKLCFKRIYFTKILIGCWELGFPYLVHPQWNFPFETNGKTQRSSEAGPPTVRHSLLASWCTGQG